jgi:two-component system, NtrC family, nitrogen regulation sensor histidine kinase GlnL
VSIPPDAKRQLASLVPAVLLIDPQFAIGGANPAAEQLLGAGERRLHGEPLSRFLNFEETRLNEWLARGDTQISAHSVALQVAKLPGRLVDLTIAPVSGAPGWQIMTLHETAKAEGLANDHEHSVRTPAILAHEIKNPLAAIRGAAQLLRRKLGDADQPMVGLITDEVDRIAKLIDRMQSLGREQSDPVGVCNLHEVIHRARTVVETAGTGLLNLREEFDPSLPAVLGSEDGLLQVLINLLSNARDASMAAREPKIIIRTRFVSGFVMSAIRLGRPIRLPIEVRISDNGPGIDPALRDHIFEPFVTSKKNGQGLGLALVKKLVRDMDGRISHERDEAGGWTHFSVHLAMAKTT